MNANAALDSLTTDATGNVVVNPLTGYVITPYGGGMGIIMRLEYATEAAGVDKPEAVQLILTMPGAAAFLESLTRTVHGAMAALEREQQQRARPGSLPPVN